MGTTWFGLAGCGLWGRGHADPALTGSSLPPGPSWRCSAPPRRAAAPVLPSCPMSRPSSRVGGALGGPGGVPVGPGRGPRGLMGCGVVLGWGGLCGWKGFCKGGRCGGERSQVSLGCGRLLGVAVRLGGGLWGSKGSRGSLRGPCGVGGLEAVPVGRGGSPHDSGSRRGAVDDGSIP